MEARKILPRKNGRVIIHFDYDCFYASVFEAKNPALKSLPFAVQQKQIIVTCNYEARRRGLYKLQLIKDAKRVCPDVIIELGEDISRFRDASKELYNFIKEFSWSGKIERLGFDEIWMDVTDMVDYNMDTINRRDLEHSFFQISRDDPTQGFEFDASTTAGHTYPNDCLSDSNDAFYEESTLPLRLGGHLALYIRHQLEQQKGYTSTVGIANSKLLSKLVGNVKKPKAQTTLMLPLTTTNEHSSTVLSFMDGHEIGKVPGIGFKLAHKLRSFILGRPAAIVELVYGATKEPVTVATVRNHQDVNPEMLEKLLGGPGSPRGIGYKVWSLLHGMDDAEVSQARAVPHQISIEDSYIRLDTMPEVLSQLDTLSRSLINRMRIDLLGDGEDFGDTAEDASTCEGPDGYDTAPPAERKWLARPKTVRLTTRPRLPLRPDGTRARTFKRISHSGPLPAFVFNLHDSVDAVAERLVRETLVNMFHKLHPEKAGWNLSLVNLAVTNMVMAAGKSKMSSGRDIGNMFKRQEVVLQDFRVTKFDDGTKIEDGSSEGIPEDFEVVPVDDTPGKEDEEDGWDEGDEDSLTRVCHTCGSHVPAFAMIAHQRFHMPDIE